MCTRIFWSDNPMAPVVSRTMDWAISDEPDLWSLPAGLTRDCGDPALLSWTSRYRSVALSMWGSGTCDGMNEKGLAAHALYLDVSEWEPADDRPAVSNLMWVQYILDSFATVAEVVAAAADVRIVSIPFRGQQMGCHVAVEDPSGDSAILEPLDGRLVVHHGRHFPVMANSPSFDEQLANLERYRPFGGELPPPGDISSLDRFVRANYFLHYLPEPTSVEEATARVFSLANNVAVPAGSPYADNGGVYPTWWTAGANLADRVYYFWSTESPNLTWVDLNELDAPGVMALDPRGTGLVGDIGGSLAPAALTY
ncbi:linear amide C-N hydrolase [Nakamurella flavida]|uniref:Linear amide C-N hydrolase n=1 Tax=Nakamurella flavida TaxID=363630 RepID=A0A938YL93_9ACTN|nr:linear amide C-N hydrolase [Nakamurella flavida]MBM9475430.1 linear amide C-N hydrolase [Nakamurella flavida]MBM9475482.1 linear amide C-N hydrolase [Nakamurella flavida]MDP9777010.1 choloylglycine hydrolase [Nakamurella flavida]